MAISLERATLVSIFVECILYGLFLSLFAISSTILLKRKATDSLNKPVLAVSVAMLVFSTVHVGVDLQRILKGFLDRRTSASDYLPDVDDPLFILKCASYDLQTITGDAFFIYRVYLVWQRNRLIALPLVLSLLGSIGVAGGTLHSFTTVSTGVFTSNVQHWITAFFIITLVTNFTCTCLIAGRIWWIHRTTKGRIASGPNLAASMILVIESGAIYTLCLIILMALYGSGTYAQYIALDAVTQLIGIVFLLIIVRVGLGLSPERSKRQGPSPPHISFSTAFSQSQNGQTFRNSTGVPPISSGVSRYLPRMPKRTHSLSRVHDLQMNRLQTPIEVKVTAVRTSDHPDHSEVSSSIDQTPNELASYEDPHDAYKAVGDSPRNNSHSGCDTDSFGDFEP